jgi:uncharacterized glyoxalase superfamily protein PhnB
MQSDKQFLGIAPYFFVRDINKAVAYYRDVLGFKVEKIWGEPPCFAMPSRDGLIVMLSEQCDESRIRPNGADGEFWDAYIWVKDADKLFAEFKSKGATVVYEPVDREFYGNREFAVKDLDGYVLAFAHDIASHRKSVS